MSQGVPVPEHEQRQITDEQFHDAVLIRDYHRMGHEWRLCSAAIGLGSPDLGVATTAVVLYLGVVQSVELRLVGSGECGSRSPVLVTDPGCRWEGVARRRRMDTTSAAPHRCRASGDRRWVRKERARSGSNWPWAAACARSRSRAWSIGMSSAAAR